MAGAWMTFPLWEHYAFTGDLDFLRKTAYPLLKGAAEFAADFLVPGPGGFLVTAPSHSPENAYVDPATGNPGNKVIGDPFLVPSPLLAAFPALPAVLGHDPGISREK